MAKDPAFLFYSKDFYEGTRTMLPEERACYIDLLIYQHQNNGIIPLDLRRILLYCNGIDKATLEATLEAKFKRTETGFINTKLKLITSERKEYSLKQSVSGSVGQFWKKCKAILSTRDYNKLRSNLKGYSNNEIYDFIKNKEINKQTLKGLLEALLKHLAIEDVIENGNGNDNLFKVPSMDEIKKYCKERRNTIDPNTFFNFYEGKGWMIGKNKMKDWKACMRTWESNEIKKNNNNKTTQSDDNR